ncbi:uncharacterized protein LOC132623631 [Lycium barbarum]|uniref:uncharacterized protein LOC132046019 n=1 Tax=Lycium ferocissimum TaxID=112874 RepID=UPI002816877A|nr:uncharacterized protein LOC132046019 [Lycium ferocissimum]XP_059292558.1 uncharacterized protein LOC132046019 [Lycium ferocissimum]XP_059292561.1 uncharacterized protein LOC132046019 [Lycium ferocissimum]XP_059292567.1 uncharacterized protein LOC132046019 [Lycium ferocissimum]XP_060194397.1 uncharacterized protein LOC132623631 [Lycium barbarum]XP_060194398.1 uncharacterized protein LOC132623631 [Lycium barbarum]XP_060194399.1 uncharacterized protein LOC132623631 [Lycium barbarum]XP_060194
MMKLFDSHCHLQDPRIINMVPKIIRTTTETGVVHFAVNGVSEKDWHLVKEMSESYPCIVPNFGLHPWFITERTPNWLKTLRGYLEATPAAAVGEIGIDKGSFGKKIDFADQVDVCRQQLQLANELERPASIHCVRAFGDLLELLKSVGPVPAGFILHSYLGSAEMVPEFAKLGAYFSFSGFLMSMKESKAKKMLKSVPKDRILLETDAPDALPKLSDPDSLYLIEREASLSDESSSGGGTNDGNPSDNSPQEDKGNERQAQTIHNHPANIHHVLSYVASLVELTKEELAEISFANASRLFSYEGSKVQQQV